MIRGQIYKNIYKRHAVITHQLFRQIANKQTDVHTNNVLFDGRSFAVRIVTSTGNEAFATRLIHLAHLSDRQLTFHACMLRRPSGSICCSRLGNCQRDNTFLSSHPSSHPIVRNINYLWIEINFFYDSEYRIHSGL